MEVFGIFRTQKSLVVKNALKCFSSVITRNTTTAAELARKSDHSKTDRIVLENDLGSTKPYSEIPQDKGFPLLRTYYRVFKFGTNMIKQQKYYFDKYGPIYRENILGKFDFVYMRDEESIERLHRLEGKYPLRLMLDPWRKWRDKHGHAFGILISEGEHWKRMRSELDKKMMRPKEVSQYTNSFNEVVSDFVNRIRQIRKENNDIEKLNIELFHWSLETVGTLLYETRLGSFTGNRTQEIGTFINAVHDMFVSTNKITYMPDLMKKTFGKKWVEVHEKSWDIIFTTTTKLIDNKIKEIETKMQNNEDVSGFLSTLLASSKLSNEEMYANISELMAASVDTTSNTMQWCLYELAKKPEVQDIIAKEQETVLGGKHSPSYDDLQKMPYLKATIKETLRMYPVAGLVTRTLTEDFNLCGYCVPKGTNILMSTFWTARDPNIFPNPDKFIPERWLRKTDTEISKLHSFSFLPFGHGPRMCAGKRVAELEMQLLLAKLIQEFKLEPSSDETINIAYAGLMFPDKPVPIRFIDR